MARDKSAQLEKVKDHLAVLHRELSILSKQKPNDAVNAFKLGLVNEVLEQANRLLEEPYRPSSTFRTFDVDSMPTNSDVVMVLAQYQRSMGQQYSEERYGGI